MEREVKWLTDLINAERAGDQPIHPSDQPLGQGPAPAPDPTSDTTPSAAPAADATTGNTL